MSPKIHIHLGKSAEFDRNMYREPFKYLDGECNGKPFTAVYSNTDEIELGPWWSDRTQEETDAIRAFIRGTAG